MYNNKSPVQFHQGTDFRAYNFYGAHKIKDGYIIRVWAPHAFEIYVEGDFNDWKKFDPCSQMQKINDFGDFEITLNSDIEISSYRFIIVSDNGIYEKSDPFAFYSETNNEQYYSQYFDIDRFCWNDENWLKFRSERNIIKEPLNIYEVHLGSWKRENGEFYNYRKAAEEIVSYVKDMGYTHIEILPIAEHPFYGSWGYQSCGYFSPTSRYGNPDDLMYFVDYCHTHGIGVLLDWMPACFPKDKHGLYKFDGNFCYEYSDDFKREQAAWGTCMFDLGKPEVQSFLISNAFYWIEKFHFDGLRVDAVSPMIYLDYAKNYGEWKENAYGGRENLEAIDFLRKLNDSIKKEHPDVITAAEDSSTWQMVTRPTEIGGLGFTFKWNLGWTNDTINYAKTDPIRRKDCHRNIVSPFSYAFSENYILPISHDECSIGRQSFIDKMPGDQTNKIANIRTFLGYMIAHPGKKLLFMGNEFGQTNEWDHDIELEWSCLNEEEHRTLKNYVKELNLFYLEHPALWEKDSTNDGFGWIANNDTDQNIIVFQRNGNDEKLIFLANFAPVTRYDYKIGVPYECEYEEIFTSDAIYFGGTGISNGVMETYPFPMHGFNQQISLTVPPLSIICIKIKC